jgi:hypothetical protein
MRDMEIFRQLPHGGLLFLSESEGLITSVTLMGSDPAIR